MRQSNCHPADLRSPRCFLYEEGDKFSDLTNATNWDRFNEPMCDAESTIENSLPHSSGLMDLLYRPYLVPDHQILDAEPKID